MRDMESLEALVGSLEARLDAAEASSLRICARSEAEFLAIACLISAISTALERRVMPRGTFKEALKGSLTLLTLEQRHDASRLIGFLETAANMP